MQITVEPLVLEKLNALVDILIDKGYYATEAAALKYAQAIIDVIYSLPSRAARRTKDSYYGEFYITYKPNRRTTWYILFDENNGRYIVRHVTNNHSKDYPDFVAG